MGVGGSDPDATLERTSKAFRCLPAGRLLCEPGSFRAWGEHQRH